MPLGSTDLLKAFHLRAIKSADAHLDRAIYRSHCAYRWRVCSYKERLVNLVLLTILHLSSFIIIYGVRAIGREIKLLS